MSNPLVADLKTASDCFDELLEAHKDYLPQFLRKITNEKFIIGVDGGNTKTDYLLYDTEGNFIDGVRSGTCSHEVPSVGGFDGSYNIMKLRIEELLNRNHLSMDDIVAGAFGLAGVDAPFQKKL